MIQGVADIVESPEGALWLCDRDQGFALADGWNVSSWDIPKSAPGVSAGDAFPIADALVGPHASLAGPFSVSATGGLAYFRPFNISGTSSTIASRFAWFDRNGKQLALAGPEGSYISYSTAEVLAVFLSGEPRFSGLPEGGRSG